jgi:AraC-like DNA-binding protein
MPVYNYDDFGKNYINFHKNPILLHAGILINEVKWCSSLHVHKTFSEILYISQGEGEVTIGQTTHPVTSGDLIVYNPNTPHLEDYTNSTATPVIYHFALTNLSVKGLQKDMLLPSGEHPIFSTGIYRSKMETYCELIIDECKTQQLGYNHVSGNLLNSMLILMLRMIDHRSKRLGETLKKPLGSQIKAFIDANFKENLSLKELSEHFHVSPFHISHLFREENGISPINYFINCRIDEAKKLLINTPFTIRQIAEMVGYKNISHFYTQFKKSANQPPGLYRRQAGVDN